jgi:hypothetical protein
MKIVLSNLKNEEKVALVASLRKGRTYAKVSFLEYGYLLRAVKEGP